MGVKVREGLSGTFTVRQVSLLRLLLGVYWMLAVLVFVAGLLMAGFVSLSITIMIWWTVAVLIVFMLGAVMFVLVDLGVFLFLPHWILTTVRRLRWDRETNLVSMRLGIRPLALTRTWPLERVEAWVLDVRSDEILGPTRPRYGLSLLLKTGRTIRVIAWLRSEARARALGVDLAKRTDLPLRDAESLESEAPAFV